MRSSAFPGSRLLFTLGVAWLGVLAIAVPTRATVAAAPAPAVRDALSALPLVFEPNRGQTAPEARFLARGAGYAVFLAPEEVVFRLGGEAGSGESQVLRMGFTSGGRTEPSIEGLDPKPGISRYYRGCDPARWIEGVPQFGKVRYRGVYPGVDLVLYGPARRLNYDFELAPGADPRAIVVSLAGADGLEISCAGELHVHTRLGDLVQHRPVIYQQTAEGSRIPIAGGFVVEGKDRYAFVVGDHDPGRPLTIDPDFAFSTYFGGGDVDTGLGIASTGATDAYVTGYTQSTDFPTTAPFQAANAGGLDVFVTRIDLAGIPGVVYSTYLGGSGDDTGFGIAADAASDVFVTGRTKSADFPTVAALQASLGGTDDAFVSKLDATGALVYSSYLGGSGVDAGLAIAVDPTGVPVYVTGSTDSTDFFTQTPVNAANQGLLDVFVTALDLTGPAYVYSTYLGGTANDAGLGIATDGSGNAFIAGYTASAVFSLDGGGGATRAPGMVAAGGGRGRAAGTTQRGERVGLSGAAAPAGTSGAAGLGFDDLMRHLLMAPDDPVRVGFAPGGASAAPRPEDAFLVVIQDASPGTLALTDRFGGGDFDIATAVAVDGEAFPPGTGSIYLTGHTSSADFPTSAGAMQAMFGGGTTDGWVRKVQVAAGPIESTVYATYLGGAGNEGSYGIAADAAGRAYVTGFTTSKNFPTSANGLRRARLGPLDATVAMFTPDGTKFFGTYVGGLAAESGRAITVGTERLAALTGYTTSTSPLPFPTTSGAFDTMLGGTQDAFVTEIDDLRAGCGAELQVNTFTTGDQVEARVALQPGGNFVVTWRSALQDGDSTGVFARRFDPAGNPIGGEFQVNTYTTLRQDAAAVAADPSGNFLVVWQSEGQDGDGFGIYGQRFDAAGTPLGGEFPVSTYTTGDQAVPSVTVDGSSNYVVVWSSAGQDGDSDGVFGQRLDGTGSPLGVEFQVNTYTTGSQQPTTQGRAVAADPAGDFVVVWSSYQDGDANGVFGQRFDSAGMAQGAEFQVNSYTTSFQEEGAVTADAAGDFVVVWESFGQDGANSGVFGQRYDSGGVAQGAEFQVNLFGSGSQFAPTAASDAIGNFLVVWVDDSEDLSLAGVFDQHFDRNGKRVGSEFQVNVYTTSIQQNPGVAMDPVGNAVLTWESFGQDGNDFGVVARVCE